MLQEKEESKLLKIYSFYFINSSIFKKCYIYFLMEFMEFSIFCLLPYSIFVIFSSSRKVQLFINHFSYSKEKYKFIYLLQKSIITHMKWVKYFKNIWWTAYLSNKMDRSIVKRCIWYVKLLEMRLSNIWTFQAHFMVQPISNFFFRTKSLKQ